MLEAAVTHGKPSSWAHLFQEQGSVRAAALGGFERAKDQTGMVTPVAQTWEKHPEREKTLQGDQHGGFSVL